MQQLTVSSAVLLLLCGTFLSSAGLDDFEPQTPDWRKTLKTIRNGIHKIDTFLNYALDLIGGSDGLCQFKCNDGYKPIARPHYKHSPPNGCGSPLFGFHFDIGIPSMTKCCNLHDRCYDTCGQEKRDCDDQFHVCLETICRNVQITLGLDQSVQVSIAKNPSQGVQRAVSREPCPESRVQRAVSREPCPESRVQRAVSREPCPETCESAVTLLFDAVMHLGCKPYLDSQRAACICRYEEKTDL
ncbi:hypothetical protein QTP70_025502 [Hemibagrus guttatus]|uniref:Group XIIA secretory phospholipase A2 n=1 Tax=Hemibagrus guttatus TaxID=175788 RepID=A0AAE0RGH7_9TELE|nr:hypothetical protein QTP70_025502 [Hemibagrus guttatus]